MAKSYASIDAMKLAIQKALLAKWEAARTPSDVLNTLEDVRGEFSKQVPVKATKQEQGKQ